MKVGERLIDYYPSFLNLVEKLCVVVGGGKVAERKVALLLRCQAKVVVVSPDLTPNLKELAERGKITWRQENFHPTHLDGAWLVFACTNEKKVQKEVYEAAEQRKIFCNVVDDPKMSSFIVPSSIRRGPLQIAISTSGESPAVARRMRERLEGFFGEEYAFYLELMGAIREVLLTENFTEKEKERKLQILALAPMDHYLKNNNFKLIQAILEKEGLTKVLQRFSPYFSNRGSKDRERQG